MTNEDLAADIAAIARIDSVQKILELVCRTTGLGFSAVARVTDTHWIACAVRDEIAFGLKPGGELPLETTLCNEIRQQQTAVVIEHVAQDALYCDHHTPKLYGFQSYASFPIRLPDGRFFGTLCAIDPRPALLKKPEITAMFQSFADLIGMQLQSLDRIADTEAALLSAREATQLREQFMAVLGHDLRNPLGAINSGVEVLRLSSLGEEDVEMLDMIQRSAGRMAGLINNVLDFARGRLGDGMSLSISSNTHLEDELKQVVAELRQSSPHRNIDTDFVIEKVFPCDGARIAQMLSNLISNALAHGDPASPVMVRAATSADRFELSVTNFGNNIPPEVIDRLFQPFVRGSIRKGQQGLGLGLYIASEIARGHQGVLNVTSVNNQTCFTFRMPIKSE